MSKYVTFDKAMHDVFTKLVGPKKRDLFALVFLKEGLWTGALQMLKLMKRIHIFILL